MTSNELRSKYLDFFKDKSSLIVPSASLVPTDPTTLLTSAGMQPLVPYFKGEETPPATRLASCQKCCRADDIENVGVTWRHASFFEMLGNFSFGDYFKREAIIFAWEFLTETLAIDPKLLWVSVYQDDEEAPGFWKNDIGLSDDRILRFGKKDNWWGPVGKTGPCGPDSEIFFDRGPQYNTGDPEMDRPGGDGDRYGELWNLVFQQYNQQEDGSLPPLPAPGIDTGMGLERTAAVLQGVDTIHHTDLFAPIINAIDQIRRGSSDLTFSATPLPLDPADPTTRPMKVIADHIRAATFMAADGIVPGHNGRDYMMRRFIRRSLLMGRQLGLEEAFLFRLVPIIEQVYAGVYPEVGQRQAIITDLIRREEQAFDRTIERGTNRLTDLVSSVQGRGESVLPGKEVFDLYQTYGFPRELTAEVVEPDGLTIDEAGYEAARQHHAEQSGSSVGEYEKRDFGALETEFIGYDNTDGEATILAVREDDGQTQVVLDRTPFYAESGGQIGDVGTLSSDGFQARVTDTRKQGRAFVHILDVQEGQAREGMTVQAKVDVARRRAIMRAHTATHLLQAALRRHLGEHVAQRGSLVEPDRLRFDFVHYSALTPEEIAKVEDTLNEQILEATPVDIRLMKQAEARAMGAMALFGEKYGDIVRTVRMGDFSLELCGGTHLPTTAAVGLCRIVSEGGIGSNLRRVEALTGTAALSYDRAQGEKLSEVARQLGVPVETAPAAAEKLRGRVRDLEKQVQAAQQKMAGASVDEMLKNTTAINGLMLAAARAPENLSADALRELADRLAAKMLAAKMDGVVVLAGEANGKVLWAVKVSKNAVERGAHAGNLVRELAKITGGGGGGRPDFAQAGGKDALKIEEALAHAPQLLAAQMG